MCGLGVKSCALVTSTCRTRGVAGVGGACSARRCACGAAGGNVQAAVCAHSGAPCRLSRAAAMHASPPHPVHAIPPRASEAPCPRARRAREAHGCWCQAQRSRQTDAPSGPSAAALLSGGRPRVRPWARRPWPAYTTLAWRAVASLCCLKARTTYSGLSEDSWTRFRSSCQAQKSCWFPFFLFFLNTKIKANAFVLMVEQGEGPARVRGACRPASPSFGGRVAWRGWLGGGRALCRRPRVDRGGVRAARRRLRRGRRGTPQAACGAGPMAPNATATPRSTAGASAAAMTGRGTADASLGGAVLSVFPASLVFGTDTRGARRLLTVKVRAQPLRRPTAGARARWTPAVVAD